LGQESFVPEWGLPLLGFLGVCLLVLIVLSPIAVVRNQRSRTAAAVLFQVKRAAARRTRLESQFDQVHKRALPEFVAQLRAAQTLLGLSLASES
jgi:hypothetical protein